MLMRLQKQSVQIKLLIKKQALVEAGGQDNFDAQCDRQTTIVQALREEGEWCNAGQSRPDLVMFTEQSLLYFHTHVTSSYDLA